MISYKLLVTKSVENQTFCFYRIHAMRVQITFLESAYISASHHMKITISRDFFVFLYNIKQANLYVSGDQTNYI